MIRHTKDSLLVDVPMVRRGGGLPDSLHVVVGMLEEDTVGAHEVHQND